MTFHFMAVGAIGGRLEAPLSLWSDVMKRWWLLLVLVPSLVFAQTEDGVHLGAGSSSPYSNAGVTSPLTWVGISLLAVGLTAPVLGNIGYVQRLGNFSSSGTVLLNAALYGPLYPTYLIGSLIPVLGPFLSLLTMPDFVDKTPHLGLALALGSAGVQLVGLVFLWYGLQHDAPQHQDGDRIRLSGFSVGALPGGGSASLSLSF